jgi:hypothetical protein
MFVCFKINETMKGNIKALENTIITHSAILLYIINLKSNKK